MQTKTLGMDLDVRLLSLALRQLADELNRRGIATPRGGTWFPSSVQNALARLEAVAA